jgi:hypothetical protein
VRSLIQSQQGTIINEFDKLRWALIQFPQEENIFTIIESFSENPYIEAIEPEIVGQIYYDPNDSLYQAGMQWNFYNYGQAPFYGTSGSDINVRQAWDITTGSSNVLIGVLDTGIPLDTITLALTHPDLSNSSRIKLGSDCVIGYRVEETDSSVADLNDHGSFVTGIIAAETNNNIGIAGIAGNCKVLVMQVFSKLGKTTAPATKKAILAAVDSGAKIINYSGGFGQSNPQELQDAIHYADSLGVLFIDHSNVMGVGATTKHDAKAGYSNFGAGQSVVAPGGSDEYPQGDIYRTELYATKKTGYGYWLGTSFAAPHVSGVAGLILSVITSLSPSQVRTIIQNTADDKGATGFDTVYGYGRINAGKAMQKITSAPESLTIKVPTGTNNPKLKSKPSWCVDLYRIYRSWDPSQGFDLIDSVDAPDTFFVDANVAIGSSGGDTVFYRVTAVLANYETAPSNQVSINHAFGIEYKTQLVALSSKPTTFSLSGNYPNPFNPTTHIKYALPEDAHVVLKVFDILGREVATIVNETKLAGWYDLEFNGENLPSSLYFYRLQAGKFVEVKKMILLK